MKDFYNVDILPGDRVRITGVIHDVLQPDGCGRVTVIVDGALYDPVLLPSKAVEVVSRDGIPMPDRQTLDPPGPKA